MPMPRPATPVQSVDTVIAPDPSSDGSPVMAPNPGRESDAHPSIVYAPDPSDAPEPTHLPAPAHVDDTEALQEQRDQFDARVDALLADLDRAHQRGDEFATLLATSNASLEDARSQLTTTRAELATSQEQLVAAHRTITDLETQLTEPPAASTPVVAPSTGTAAPAVDPGTTPPST